MKTPRPRFETRFGDESLHAAGPVSLKPMPYNHMSRLKIEAILEIGPELRKYGHLSPLRLALADNYAVALPIDIGPFEA